MYFVAVFSNCVYWMTILLNCVFYLLLTFSEWYHLILVCSISKILFNVRFLLAQVSEKSKKMWNMNYENILVLSCFAPQPQYVTLTKKNRLTYKIPTA